MSIKFEGKPPYYLGIAEVASAHALDGNVVLRAHKDGALSHCCILIVSGAAVGHSCCKQRTVFDFRHCFLLVGDGVTSNAVVQYVTNTFSAFRAACLP